jgi:hypothetical protein
VICGNSGIFPFISDRLVLFKWEDKWNTDSDSARAGAGFFPTIVLHVCIPQDRLTVAQRDGFAFQVSME